ncbi:MAG: hypothetical protein ACE1Y1_04475, partial [Nitrosomonadaceae bacterium]
MADITSDVLSLLEGATSCVPITRKRVVFLGSLKLLNSVPSLFVGEKQWTDYAQLLLDWNKNGFILASFFVFKADL